MNINYKSYAIEEMEQLYGPGKRLVLWTQGCSIHCEGCFNSHLWPFGIGSNIESSEIVEICKSSEVEGITLLGGEPLDQAVEICELMDKLKSSDFTIILFTGYEYKELDKIKRACWKRADIVICGKYVGEKTNVKLQFRSSSNQKVIFHNGKYKNYVLRDEPVKSEIRVNKDGSIIGRGFLNKELTVLLGKLTDNGDKYGDK
jgi:anaerobic ribonucleoside-triphosphate reductase activating protein